MFDTRLSGAVRSACIQVNGAFGEGSAFTDHYMRVGKNFYPDMSDISLRGVIISCQGYLTMKDVQVFSYRPWWWRTKMVAFTKGTNIHLNVYKMKRTVHSFAGSFAHELVHIADMNNWKYSFGHGDNNRYGKRKTAPYLIGILMNHYLETGRLYTRNELEAWNPHFK